ncbi:MAG: prenyltransferase/squalene oxidase repeat-containing protein [Planctomycetota bacterium]|jgi:hypothetical protein
MKPAALLLVLVGFLALAAPVRAEDDRPHRWVRDAELKKRISRAIEGGVAYLRGTQMSDGRWTYANSPMGGRAGRPPDPGRRLDPTTRREGIVRQRTQARDAGLTALALYALAASGAGPRDKTVAKGLEWIKLHPREYDKQATVGTYSLSLLILALTRIDAVEHGPSIRILADRLVAAQAREGMWSYRLRPPKSQPFARVGASKNAGDSSNTQFAVLALWAAHSLAGHKAPAATWTRVERLYRRAQDADGHWPYALSGHSGRAGSMPVPRSARSATMTAAGLVSHVYASAAIDARETALQRARTSPLARRGLNAFRSSVGKRMDWSNLYLVYSVERVGTVLGLRDLSWYETGAIKLCDAQEEHGRWKDTTKHGDSRQVYATSLALLFLNRATLPPRRGAIAPVDRIDVLTPGERRPMLQTTKSHQRAFEIYLSLPKKTRRADAPLLGARGKEFVDLLVQLIATDGRSSARAAAHELLEALLGKRLLYDPRAAEREREIMTRLIRDTWRGMKRNAVWDARQRRFVSRP